MFQILFYLSTVVKLSIYKNISNNIVEDEKVQIPKARLLKEVIAVLTGDNPEKREWEQMKYNRFERHFGVRRMKKECVARFQV